MRIAVVGDTTSVEGFRPLGFSVHPVERPDAARALWPELVSGEYAVVFMTEPVYEVMDDLVAEVSDRALPAVSVIPGAGSAGGVGQAKLARSVERALGTKMLLGDEGS